ncbi:putative acetyltransferase [Bhargavaea cecembensis DSE10]|uniref:Putative acetyltransferase n=1 Tax=Bhargavaea cecembensis DSE10 TaxID=1235279 RepID=M7N8M8_9BACL|nr:N-acetyltransferase [Bhargavaea cecembensis]EMR04958.1 putative acetyltransferase [Bhargavaea cecembensis DSE10]
MEIFIRQSLPRDFESISEVVEQAFRHVEMSDHREHILVGRLRVSDAYVPELSIVAENEAGQIVGHILLSKIRIVEGENAIDSLALAPVSVLPKFQNQGIGSRLIQAALDKAEEIGFRSVIVLGHPEYYPRFSFRKASEWGIHPPFDVPDEVFMAVELKEGTLNRVRGVVEYPEPFNETATEPM